VHSSEQVSPSLTHSLTHSLDDDDDGSQLVNKTKSGETLQELKDLLKSTHNWKKYREVLKTCDPPCIPYLGMPSLMHHSLSSSFSWPWQY